MSGRACPNHLIGGPGDRLGLGHVVAVPREAVAERPPVDTEIAADLLQADENKYLSVMMPCTFAVYEKSDGKTYIAMMNLGVVGQAIGGDVVTAMEKAMPDMEKMVDFENPPAQPAPPPAESMPAPAESTTATPAGDN